MVLRFRTNGKTALLPLLFTGPLVLNRTRRIAGLLPPRIDDGAVAANRLLTQKLSTRPQVWIFSCKPRMQVSEVTAAVFTI